MASSADGTYHSWPPGEVDIDIDLESDIFLPPLGADLGFEGISLGYRIDRLYSKLLEPLTPINLVVISLRIVFTHTVKIFHENLEPVPVRSISMNLLITSCWRTSGWKRTPY